jgi:acylphosphatase
MTEPLTSKHLRVAGRVQGVGYRANFAREAQRLGLSGWVRNRLDGTVEALVQGGVQEVNEIIAWARRGPRMARVDSVQLSDMPHSDAHASEFKVLPTE